MDAPAVRPACGVVLPSACVQPAAAGEQPAGASLGAASASTRCATASAPAPPAAVFPPAHAATWSLADFLWHPEELVRASARNAQLWGHARRAVRCMAWDQPLALTARRACALLRAQLAAKLADPPAGADVPPPLLPLAPPASAAVSNGANATTPSPPTSSAERGSGALPPLCKVHGCAQRVSHNRAIGSRYRLCDVHLAADLYLDGAQMRCVCSLPLASLPRAAPTLAPRCGGGCALVIPIWRRAAARGHRAARTGRARALPAGENAARKER
jgi:hypothetical protein